jgi:micrococcal nuclease
LDIDLGFGLWIHGESIRLFGVDCPECRSRDKEEKAAGLAAKDFVKRLLHDGGTYTLTTKEKGKFGRYLGTIFLTEKTSINDALVKERLAVPYFGQSKVRVKEAHLANRKFLKEKGVL